jgi:hypothetical protein
LFTLVYRNRFLEKLEHGCARSLAWPRNRAAIDGAIWDIYSYPEERERITQITAGVGLKIQFHDIPDIHAIESKLMAVMLDHARLCVSEGAAMFTAQPDLIFGEGSIEAMVRVAAENRELCVALPHPRVNDAAFVQAMPSGVIENAQLVSLAMQHLHSSFASADMVLENVSTWHGGVSWRRLGEGLYGVTCNTPTIFLARLIPEDVAVLKKAGDGAWDHIWPTTLMKEQRQRLIGSSDAAFVVELTHPRSHVPDLRRKPPGAPYTYRHDRDHHKVNRNTVSVWRGNSVV